MISSLIFYTFIFLVILVLIGYKEGWDDSLFDFLKKQDISDWLFGTLLSSIFAMSTILIVTLIHTMTSGEVVKDEVRLESLYNSEQTTGGIFLFVGGIGENQYYTYIKETDNGDFVKGRVKETYNGRVRIRTYNPDSTDNYPKIEQYYKRAKDNIFVLDGLELSYHKVVIQIPEGSLKREIEIK